MTKNNTVQQNIPQGWQENKLLDCLRVPSKLAGIKLSEYEKEGDFPVFDQGQDYISGRSSNKDLVVKDVPAILFGDHTRVVKFIRSPFVAGADGTKIFWAKDGFDPTFLYYLVLKQKIPNTGYNRHFKFFKDIKVTVPKSKKEQRKIAEVLGTVDEDIAKTQEVIEATEKLKRGLMQQLFTRGIGHTKFKETKIGEIPEEWDAVKLLTITELITKGTTPTTYGHAFIDTGVNFFKIENIDENGNIDLSVCKHISTNTHEFLKRSQLSKGDILFSIAGALGRIAIVKEEQLPANVNQAIAIVRLKDKSAAKFVAMALITEHVKGQTLNRAVQMAQANVSLGQLSEMIIPWPLKSEQNEIADILSAVDEKISVNKKLKSKLTLLKKGLMQDLLSGTVRINI